MHMAIGICIYGDDPILVKAQLENALKCGDSVFVISACNKKYPPGPGWKMPEDIPPEVKVYELPDQDLWVSEFDRFLTQSMMNHAPDEADILHVRGSDEFYIPETMKYVRQAFDDGAIHVSMPFYYFQYYSHDWFICGDLWLPRIKSNPYLSGMENWGRQLKERFWRHGMGFSMSRGPHRMADTERRIVCDDPAYLDKRAVCWMSPCFHTHCYNSKKDRSNRVLYRRRTKEALSTEKELDIVHSYTYRRDKPHITKAMRYYGPLPEVFEKYEIYSCLGCPAIKNINYDEHMDLVGNYPWNTPEDIPWLCDDCDKYGYNLHTGEKIA